MSRGRNHPKINIVQPDPVYQSVALGKFINYILLDGKKSVAQKIVYTALEQIGKKTNLDPMEVFDTAIKNASPVLEVKGKRIGGANYQIPFEVPRARRQTLAMKWMIASARGKQGKPMSEFLAEEITDAYHNTGAAMKKKDDMHRMADANKAFAHFAKFTG
ncbi:MAG: 30S ribosomal protein S7 [Patescibacteria group bacterium]|jgi:small subunit ribosomal protein S7